MRRSHTTILKRETQEINNEKLLLQKKGKEKVINRPGYERHVKEEDYCGPGLDNTRLFMSSLSSRKKEKNKRVNPKVKD